MQAITNLAITSTSSKMTICKSSQETRVVPNDISENRDNNLT